MIESELLDGVMVGFFSCVTFIVGFLFTWCLPSKKTLKNKHEQFPKRSKS